jgi:hypothetical protein
VAKSAIAVSVSQKHGHVNAKPCPEKARFSRRQNREPRKARNIAKGLSCFLRVPQCPLWLRIFRTRVGIGSLLCRKVVQAKFHGARKEPRQSLWFEIMPSRPRYNESNFRWGCFMQRVTVATGLFLSVFLAAVLVCAQNKVSAGSATNPQASAHQGPTSAASAPKITSNAPHMSKQTRLEIIRDFETQLVYSRTLFPMGTKGLALRGGVVTPSGQDLQQLLALWGPSIRPGDPAHISYVRIKDDHIHFDLNGGAVRRKKWYQHIEVSGTGGAPVPLSNDQSTDNPHGSYLDIYFEKYVPEMSAAQLRDVLLPVLDFTAHNKEEAYLDSVPPKVKEAIQAHHVLVGMNSEMVVHAMGKAPRKVREKDGDTEYEEWIYGQPPDDVNFVRIVGDEVVRVETMKIGGEKIVRTEKEVILDNPDKEAEAKKQERPANAPSLRRPGEDSEEVPKPAGGINQAPPMSPGGVPQPGGGSPGPGDVIGGR